MKKLCDLHTHSIYSDGTFTPTEIIEAASQIGLSAVALSDHDSIEGLPEFLAAAKNKNIEAIPGIELSVDFEGIELHLLGLYIPKKSFAQVSELMLSVNKNKEISNINLVSSLNKAGYIIDYPSIKEKATNGKVYRSHIAAELVEKGYVNSIKEALDTLLAPKHGHYKKPETATALEMIDFILDIDAVPVLAHPFLNLSEEKLRDFLPVAKKRGLAGMECFYPLYNEITTKKAIALADANHLKYSGGSDFHGANKPDISLGYGKGNLKIPYTFATGLKTIKAE